MKLLFISNLFPDQQEPIRGLDNACLLHHLRDRLPEIRVIALRPTLSPRDLISSHRNPRPEDSTLHPSFLTAPYIPKMGSRWNHRLMAARLRKRLESLRKNFEFDRVLCSWLYPDGCAVARLAREMDFPFYLICQGSDAHHYLEMPVRRRLIVDAVRSAQCTITRSEDLARRLVDAGAPEERLTTIYNGVDTDSFHPADRKETAREKLGLETHCRWLLFVGNFLPVKDPLTLIEAWRSTRQALPSLDVRLAMLGSGPLESTIRDAAATAGLSEQLHLPGRKAPKQVADYMRAADVLCLSSRNEGVPNVVLEAMASGLPVVSTDVGGIGEIIDQPELGTLVPPTDVEALAAAIGVMLQEAPDPNRIAKLGREFSWTRTADKYAEIIT